MSEPVSAGTASTQLGGYNLASESDVEMSERNNECDLNLDGQPITTRDILHWPCTEETVGHLMTG